MNNEVHCPKCGSTQITANKKGFSGGKAVAGAVLTGGIGLLAGTLGSNKVKITCLACGNQFNPGDDRKVSVASFLTSSANIHQSRSKVKIASFFGYTFLIITILILISGFSTPAERSAAGGVSLITGLVSLLFFALRNKTSQILKNHDNPEQLLIKQPLFSKNQKIIIGFLSILILISFALPNQSVSNAKEKLGSDPSSSSSPSSAVNVNSNTKSESSWNYESETDKMTSGTTYNAYITALEELNLKSPYSGGSIATLHLRKNSTGVDVFLNISKGQLIAATTGSDQSILVRFDNSKPETYHVSGSSDFSSETVFITAAKKFINKLKSSKRLIVEAAVYDNGNQQMEFPVANLQWNH